MTYFYSTGHLFVDLFGLGFELLTEAIDYHYRKKKKQKQISNMSSVPNRSSTKENTKDTQNKKKKRSLEPYYSDDALNAYLVEKIHEKIKSQPTKNITRQVNGSKTKYSSQDKHLFTSVKKKNGMMKFTPSKNLTGTLIVYRDKEKKLADIIEYKNDKVIRVNSPKTGKTKVANLENMKMEALKNKVPEFAKTETITMNKNKIPGHTPGVQNLKQQKSIKPR